MLDELDIQVLNVVSTLYQLGASPTKIEPFNNYLEANIYLDVLKSNEIVTLDDGKQVNYGVYCCQVAKKEFAKYINTKIHPYFRWVTSLPTKEQIMNGIKFMIQD